MRYRVSGAMIVRFGVAVCWLAAGRAAAQMQETIPGMTLQEVLRLETNPAAIVEKANQREARMGVRQEELNRLYEKVEQAAREKDPLKYEAALDQYYKYFFKHVIGGDHEQMVEIVDMVKETRVLVAKAIRGISDMGGEEGEGEDLDGFIAEKEGEIEERTQAAKAEIVMLSSLLTSGELDPELEEELRGELDMAAGQNEAFDLEAFREELENMSANFADLAQPVDKKGKVADLYALLHRLDAAFRDYEVQLIVCEAYARIGQQYAENKLPLVRVQAALNRLNSISGDMPQIQGKSAYGELFRQLKKIEPPQRPRSGKLFARPAPQVAAKKGDSRRTASSRDPATLQEQIYRERLDK